MLKCDNTEYRYPGFSSLMQSFKDLGFLEHDSSMYLERWSSFIRQAMELKSGISFGESRSTDTDFKFTAKIIASHAEPLHEALEWLSLIPPNAVGSVRRTMPPLPAEPMTPLDIFTYLLSHKLRYQQNERDMVVLSHEIIAKRPNAREEVHTSSLIAYGDSEATAMARTVGLPVALTALNILDGKVSLRGVAGPTDPSVYEPVLEGMEEHGLGMKETVNYTRDTLESMLIPGIGPQAVEEFQGRREEEWTL